MIFDFDVNISLCYTNSYSSGLGIGTTPAALIEHGIDTTIVEIDPVVYDFAQKYFSLPKNHVAVIADAVSYTAELVQTSQKYDYIIHDVFTGGAEPLELFTVEFIQDLSAILKPGGVIAIVSTLQNIQMTFSSVSD